MKDRAGAKFPYRLELVDEIIVEVGLLAQLALGEHYAGDGAAGIAQDGNIAIGIGEAIIDGEVVRDPPGIA